MIVWFLLSSTILSNWILFRYLVEDGRMTPFGMKIIPTFALKKGEKSNHVTFWGGLWIYFVISPIIVVMAFLVWVFYYGTGVSMGLYSTDVFGEIPKPMIVVSFFLGFTIIAAFITDYVIRIDRFIQSYGHVQNRLEQLKINEEE
tara:strand:- start:51 stop:485 length:435 start_codon:yes stop_codon:yes gene_type:complete